MSETMSRKEAQELVAGPLRFGDQRQLEAIALLEQIEKQYQGGPVIVCTECGERKGGLKIHRIGCFLCADCTARMDAYLAKFDAEHPPVATPEPSKGCCSDCPPIGYPTDETRCDPCPRRAATEAAK